MYHIWSISQISAVCSTVELLRRQLLVPLGSKHQGSTPVSPLDDVTSRKECNVLLSMAGYNGVFRKSPTVNNPLFLPHLRCH